MVVHAHSIGSYDLQDGFTLTNQIAPLYERYLHYYYRCGDSIFTPFDAGEGAAPSEGTSRADKGRL